MSSLVKASFLMLVYAIGLVAIGWVTMTVAPPGAKAGTALLVSGLAGGLMVACAVATLLIGSNRLIGMVGIHLGLVLPLLFAIGVGGSRLTKSFNAAGAFNQAIEDSGSVQVSKEREENVPHPAGYQAVGMASMVAFSGLAFVALLMQRPKVPKKAARALPPAPAPDPDRAHRDDGE